MRKLELTAVMIDEGTPGAAKTPSARASEGKDFLSVLLALLAAPSWSWTAGAPAGPGGTVPGIDEGPDAPVVVDQGETARRPRTFGYGRGPVPGGAGEVAPAGAKPGGVSGRRDEDTKLAGTVGTWFLQVRSAPGTDGAEAVRTALAPVVLPELGALAGLGPETSDRAVLQAEVDLVPDRESGGPQGLTYGSAAPGGAQGVPTGDGVQVFGTESPVAGREAVAARTGPAEGAWREQGGDLLVPAVEKGTVTAQAAGRVPPAGEKAYMPTGLVVPGADRGVVSAARPEGSPRASGEGSRSDAGPQGAVARFPEAAAVPATVWPGGLVPGDAAPAPGGAEVRTWESGTGRGAGEDVPEAEGPTEAGLPTQGGGTEGSGARTTVRNLSGGPAREMVSSAETGAAVPDVATRVGGRDLPRREATGPAVRTDGDEPLQKGQGPPIEAADHQVLGYATLPRPAARHEPEGGTGPGSGYVLVSAPSAGAAPGGREAGGVADFGPVHGNGEPIAGAEAPGADSPARLPVTERTYAEVSRGIRVAADPPLGAREVFLPQAFLARWHQAGEVEVTPYANVPERVLAAVRHLIRTGEGRVRLELQLEPPHLGRLVVRLVLDDGALRADFLVASYEAGRAVEALLPQLRESLAGCVNLAGMGVWVHADATASGWWQSGRHHPEAPAGAAESGTEAGNSPASQDACRSGVIDCLV